MHRKTNFLVNLYWDNKYSDSDSVCVLRECVRTSVRACVHARMCVCGARARARVCVCVSVCGRVRARVCVN